MIPEKNKKYAIACLGPYDYNQYGGVGIFTGKIEEEGSDKPLYEFKISDSDETCLFIEKEIIAEIVDASELQAKHNRLVEVFNNAMEMWRKENPADTEMQLAVLNTRLEDCEIVGGIMSDNTITLKFTNPNRVKGISLMSKAKVIVERK